jgi:hypothetical protein
MAALHLDHCNIIQTQHHIHKITTASARAQVSSFFVVWPYNVRVIQQQSAGDICTKRALKVFISDSMKLPRITAAAARLCVEHHCFQLLKALTVAALLLAAPAIACGNGKTTASSMCNRIVRHITNL